MFENPKPKSVFINQLDGGYTINLQGNNFYPVKVAVTIDEVKQIINDFFTTAESDKTNASQENTSQTPGKETESESVTIQDLPESVIA